MLTDDDLAREQQYVRSLEMAITDLEAQRDRLRNALRHHVEGKAYYMMRDQKLTVAEYYQLQRDLVQGAGLWPGDIPDDAQALDRISQEDTDAHG